MKKSASLNVIYSQHIPRGRIIMHPNEGFDLGLITKSNTVHWCTKITPEEFLKGSTGTVMPVLVELLNECPNGTVQLNIHEWKNIGMPGRAVIFFDGKRLFLFGMKKEPEDV